MSAVLEFVRRNPARVYAVVLATFVVLGAYGIDLPQEAWLGLVAAVLALAGGEAVQRVEDRKTAAALEAPKVVVRPDVPEWEP